MLALYHLLLSVGIQCSSLIDTIPLILCFHLLNNAFVHVLHIRTPHGFSWPLKVSNSPLRDCVRALWVTEGLRWFTKGLSARLLQTGIFSFWLMLIYEPVKMFCLKDEFREQFRSPGSR
ncbi:uncharacterized protein DEA37_0013036 [Paragonimus westermani]|uniref:Uncharacterized protein n=1 Tax=Paragonimus westermani TaxID=34504 RepID=A0A5J4NPV5_9TREM|nr:uncharacterized protein DEA37_0013036 [Paragonimus westermani]